MVPTLVDGGSAALNAVRRAHGVGTPFGLILLDFQMPGMDGFEVATQIRADGEAGGTTIMMLSSVGERGDAARCREAGISAYLTKPVRQSLLLDAILATLTTTKPTAIPASLVTRHSLRETRRPLRILLGEDNLVNQFLAVRTLEKQGHVVVAVTDGRQVVDTHAREGASFDVILMDVQMPEVDGMQATALIRDAERGSARRIPIVALTAHAMSEDRKRCLDAGMDDYLSKPFSGATLFEVLERMSIPDRRTRIEVVPLT
jgi:CheY-like chemotaxis protein